MHQEQLLCVSFLTGTSNASSLIRHYTVIDLCQLYHFAGLCDLWSAISVTLTRFYPPQRFGEVCRPTEILRQMSQSRTMAGFQQ